MSSNNQTSAVPPQDNSRAELYRIKLKTDKVTSETVEKTREMLYVVNECKDSGINTLDTLYEQGEQLNRTDAMLDETEMELQKADIRLRNIKRANDIPCCCIPCLKCMQKDPEKSSGLKFKNEDSGINNRGQVRSKILSDPNWVGGGDNRNDQERFFPKIQGTTEEEEIEKNLDHVSRHLVGLKGIATEMNFEATRHNELIDKLNVKAERNLITIDTTTKKTVDLVKGSGSSTKSKRSCCSIS